MKVSDIELDELPLVYDSWSRSFQKSPWAGCIPNHLWPSTSRASISDILDRGARVLAGYVELPEGRRVMGYSVSEPERNVLHWLFMKRDYRGVGYGRALLSATCPSGDWIYTHRTCASARFLGSRFEWSAKAARVKG